MTSDQHLLSLIRSGDREAFDRLFRKWYPPLVAYAGHFLPREDAEDVVQDIMFAMWKNASSTFISGALGPYLHSAVRNRCLNLLDRELLKNRYHSAVRQSVLDSSAVDAYSSFSELSSRLSEVLATLPEEQRAAFVKSRSEGLKYEEIARDGGVSVKTVEYRISKAIRALRLALAEWTNN